MFTLHAFVYNHSILKFILHIYLTNNDCFYRRSQKYKSGGEHQYITMINCLIFLVKIKQLVLMQKAQKDTVQRWQKEGIDLNDCYDVMSKLDIH